MPNQLEQELKAIHCTIAEIERKQKDCVNVDRYEELENLKKEFEDKRLELLKLMEVEI